MDVSRLFPALRARIFALRCRSTVRAVARKRLEAGLLFTFLGLVASCQTATVGGLPAEDGRYLIEYGTELRELSEYELENLYLGLTLEHSSSPSPSSAIRLALLLGYPDSGHYDLDGAIALLNDVARMDPPRDSVSRSFAELLVALLDHKRGLAADHDATREVADRLAERIAELEADLEQARTSLAAEHERGERLQSQLNALIALEERLGQGGERQEDATSTPQSDAPAPE